MLMLKCRMPKMLIEVEGIFGGKAKGGRGQVGQY
jgi:hypothetical protein